MKRRKVPALNGRHGTGLEKTERYNNCTNVHERNFFLCIISIFLVLLSGFLCRMIGRQVVATFLLFKSTLRIIAWRVTESENAVQTC